MQSSDSSGNVDGIPQHRPFKLGEGKSRVCPCKVEQNVIFCTSTRECAARYDERECSPNSL